MKWDWIHLLILLFIITIFITSCAKQKTNGILGSAEEQLIQSSELSKPKVTAKQSSELILDISEFNEDYVIQEKAPRLKSDISQDSIDLGWKEGYYVRFARLGNNLFDISVVKQRISVYPIENVSKILDIPRESDAEITYEELPSPLIGDRSKAWRVTTKDEFGNSQRSYEIEFIKMDIYEILIMSGTATDYEILKKLALKAESRIE